MVALAARGVCKIQNTCHLDGDLSCGDAIAPSPIVYCSDTAQPFEKADPIAL